MSGQINHPPERIIQQLLVDLGGLVIDPGDIGSWPCYVGIMPETPDNCVSVSGTTGEVQGREMVGGVMVEKYGFQVRIRANGPVDGYVKGARIQQAMNQNVLRTPVTVMDESGTATTDYIVQAITPKGPVVRLGQEGSSRRHVHTINSIVSLAIAPS